MAPHLLDVAQGGGRVRDLDQQPLTERPASGFSGQQGPQAPDLAWFISGQRAGVARLSNGLHVAVCGRHGWMSRMAATDPLNVDFPCPYCDLDLTERRELVRFAAVCVEEGLRHV